MKKLFALSLLLSIMSVTSLFGETVKIGDLYYELDDSELTGVVVADESGEPYSLKRVIIPDSIQYEGQTYQVTRIEESAFDGCANLEYVDISNGIIGVGNAAFKDCPNLTTVLIPTSVKTIGYAAFFRCNNLHAINYKGDLKSWFDKEWNPAKIGLNYALCIDNKIVDGITITDTLKANAFYGCTSLSSIIIPSSVNSIDPSSFGECANLKDIYYEGDIVDWCEKSWSTKVLPDQYNLFISQENVTNLVIPVSIDTIPEDAFQGCGSLVSVTFHMQMLYIGAGAFEKCNRLKDIYHCGDLSDWSSMTREMTSFPDGFNLYLQGKLVKNAVFPKNMTEIRDGVFYGCGSLVSANIPSHIKKMGAGVFIGCTNLVSVTVPSSITSINDWTFYGCKNLTSVKMPSSITSIGQGAFGMCESLISIIIPSNVTSIGENAFYACKHLENIYYDGDIKDWCSKPWDARIFPQKYNLYFKKKIVTNVILPETLTEVPQYAFCKCKSIQSLTLPEKITRIGAQAFAQCTNLKEIYSYPQRPPIIAWDNGFVNISKDVVLYIPKGRLQAYTRNAYYSMKRMKMIEMKK